MTELCREAGVNRTTFYANYDDLFALADAVQKNLEAEVFDLYREERERKYNSNDFLKLFRHIRENQLFYKTYFKLGMEGFRLRSTMLGRPPGFMIPIISSIIWSFSATGSTRSSGCG